MGKENNFCSFTEAFPTFSLPVLVLEYFLCKLDEKLLMSYEPQQVAGDTDDRTFGN